MKFLIRNATPEDMPQVLALIKELALFENEADAVEVSVAQLTKDGFGQPPLFTCFVAEIEKEIKGMALVYPRYSTWKGAALHLEDLIVTESMRGSGIGTALLNKVIAYGASLGVKRVNWEVLDWNTPAIDFYESKGANVMRDWNVVHLNEKGIQNYIKNI